MSRATKSSILIPGWPLAEQHHLSVGKHCLHWGVRMKTSLAVLLLGSLPAALAVRRGDQFPEQLPEVILSRQAFSSLTSPAGQSRHNSSPLLWDLLPEAPERSLAAHRAWLGAPEQGKCHGAAAPQESCSVSWVTLWEMAQEKQEGNNSPSSVCADEPGLGAPSCCG